MSKFQNSKLIQTFQMLSNQERLLLKTWLASPWCNSNKRLYKFYLLIAKPNTNFTNIRFSDKKLFDKLFDNKTFNKQLLSNLKTDFVKQIENFLIHQQLRKEKDFQEKMLANAYFDMQAFDNYKKKSSLRIKSKQAKLVKTWEDYLELTLLYENLYFLPADKNNQKPDVKDLLLAEKNLELFYALGKFRLRLGKMSNPSFSEKESQTKYNLNQLQQLYRNIKHPAIKLYNRRNTRPKKWNYNHFIKFKSMLLESFLQLSNKDQKILLFSAINDAVILNSKKELRANQDMHELYDFGLKNETLIFNNVITGTTFVNIINISISLKKYHYAQKFIKNYTQLLADNIQKEASFWAKGQILYSQKKYKECIKCFKQIQKYNYAPFAITQRSTTLKALFDKAVSSKKGMDSLAFGQFCNSFDQYIRRINFLSKERTESYLRFIQHSAKLINILYTQATITEKEKIKLLIEQEENCFGKQWILTKLKEI